MTFISVKKIKGFNYAMAALPAYKRVEKLKEVIIKEIGVFQGAS